MTHELWQIIVKSIPLPLVGRSGMSEVDITADIAEKVSIALAAKHEVLFDALKLLRKPATRKKAATTAAAPVTDKKK